MLIDSLPSLSRAKTFPIHSLTSNKQVDTQLRSSKWIPRSSKLSLCYLLLVTAAFISCKNTSPRPQHPGDAPTDGPGSTSQRPGSEQPGVACLTEYPFPGTYALSPAAVRTAPGDPAHSEVGYGTNTCAARTAPAVNTQYDFLALNIEDSPSPNYSDRGGTPISGIVIHNTIGTFEGARATLRNPNGADGNPTTGDRVSAHMLIGRNGKVAKLVDEKFAAWHAMQVNKSTLGIELEAWNENQDITPEQERSLTTILAHWMSKYDLSRDKITTHRTHVATACPSLLWTTEADFLNWRSGLSLP